MTTSIVLTGLDGSNPLGFLAALGTLAAIEAADASARLSWMNEGRWRPLLTSSFDRAGLIERLASDLRTWDGDPAVALSYAKAAKIAKEGTKKKATEPKVAQDLKPTPARFRAYSSCALAVPIRSCMGRDVPSTTPAPSEPTLRSMAAATSSRRHFTSPRVSRSS
jgi:hypothetical protein